MLNVTFYVPVAEIDCRMQRHCGFHAGSPVKWNRPKSATNTEPKTLRLLHPINEHLDESIIVDINLDWHLYALLARPPIALPLQL